MAEESFLHESAKQVMRSIEARCENPNAAKEAAKEFVSIFSQMAGVSGHSGKEPEKKK